MNADRQPMKFHDTLTRQPIERLIPFARNARTHSDEQIAQLMASLTEWGFTNPCLITPEGTLICGHGRVLAAQRLGWTEVPCIVAEGWTEAQVRAYVIADNKLALNAGWDSEMLALELSDLQGLEFDLGLTGFGSSEIEALLQSLESQDHPSSDSGLAEDEIPDRPATPITRLGDVWIFGDNHRLGCGDATSREDVARVLDGDRADLLFTSPPYGQQRDYGVAKSQLSSWDTLMRGVFGHLATVMNPDGQVLVNLGLIHRDNEVIPYWDGWLSWMQGQGWRRFGWYVWDQGPGLPGDWNGRLAPAFEFLFHFNRESRRPNKFVPCSCAGEVSHADPTKQGLRAKDGSGTGWRHAYLPTQDYKIPDAVIRIMRHKGKIGDDIDHPAVFAVDLPVHLMLAYSTPDQIVLEPFCGSGSSILAGERTGRHVLALEIDPGYVDVAIKRWQQHHEAPVTLAETGQTFDEVAAERQDLEVAA
jgi:DNA modification methylase